MTRCYSEAVPFRQSASFARMPRMWVLSDRRNDAALEQILRRMPRGSAFVFRHYHLAMRDRRKRFDELAALARSRGHLVVLAGPAQMARAWGADAQYAAPARFRRAPGMPLVATAHSLREIAAAHRAGAAAVMISPVYPTRSHPGSPTLGPVRALLLARQARVPAIFLGGMDPRRGAHLAPHGWAAIDGFLPRNRDIHKRRHTRPGD